MLSRGVDFIRENIHKCKDLEIRPEVQIHVKFRPFLANGPYPVPGQNFWPDWKHYFSRPGSNRKN